MADAMRETTARAKESEEKFKTEINNNKDTMHNIKEILEQLIEEKQIPLTFMPQVAERLPDHFIQKASSLPEPGPALLQDGVQRKGIVLLQRAAVKWSNRVLLSDRIERVNELKAKLRNAASLNDQHALRGMSPSY